MTKVKFLYVTCPNCGERIYLRHKIENGRVSEEDMKIIEKHKCVKKGQDALSELKETGGKE